MIARWVPLCLGTAFPFLVACGAGEKIDQSGEQAPAVPVERIAKVLQPGAVGPEVRGVYEYLRSIGYFPSADLYAAYPRWTPVVMDEPASPSEFGPELEEAVREFQRRHGVEVTGSADHATLTAMVERPCRFPDSGAVADDEKWDIDRRIWTSGTVRYRITAYPPSGEITQTNVHNAFIDAINRWGTNVVFQRVTDNSFDLEIKFYPGGSPPDTTWTTMGSTTRGFASQTAPFRMGFNDDINWWWGAGVNPSPPAGRRDLARTLIHEFGHTLGLDHSGLSTAQMHPNTNNSRNLTSDDTTGISTIYGFWTGFNGFATDVAAGHASPVSQPNVWVASFGDTIWKYNWSAGEFDLTWGVGRQIAVTQNGIPWVVDAANDVWEGDDTDGVFWTWRGKARDVGANGTHVWTISNTAASGGNFVVNQWDGSAFVATNGIGVRISVEPAGRAWVVQANGSIWRRNFGACPPGSPPSCGWDPMPGCARDIGAGADGNVYAIGCNANSAGTDFGVWVWNEQPGTTSGGPPAIERARWVALDGQGVRVSGAPDGRQFVAGSDGSLWRRTMR